MHGRPVPMSASTSPTSPSAAAAGQLAALSSRQAYMLKPVCNFAAAPLICL